MSTSLLDLPPTPCRLLPRPHPLHGISRLLPTLHFTSQITYVTASEMISRADDNGRAN
jgi:hypothetical protein